MKAVIVFRAVAGLLWMCSGVYAQQDINYYCLVDCVKTGKHLDECRAICSTRNDAGELTKDTDWLSRCLVDKGYTALYCYSSCPPPPPPEETYEGAPEETPEQTPEETPENGGLDESSGQQ